MAKFTIMILTLTIILMTCLNAIEADAEPRNRGNRNGKRREIIHCCSANSCLTSNKRLNHTSTKFVQTVLNLATSLKTTEENTPSSTEESSESQETTTIADETGSDAGTELSTEVMTMETISSSVIPEQPTSEVTQPQSTPPVENITSTTVETTSTTTPLPTTPQVFPNCSETSVVKDPLAFNNNGLLKEPESYGYWLQSCDQLFLFGKTLMSWKENIDKCFNIGMQPLAFANATKNQCFRNMTTLDWTFAENYWTCGLKTDISVISWCSANVSSTLQESPTIPWTGVSKVQEDCVQLSVLKDNATYQLKGKMCNESLFFACQGPTTTPPPCSSPSCPNVTCQKKASFFLNSTNATAEEGSGEVLSNTNLHGNWYRYKGRLFLFSYPNLTQTFTGAIKACCEVGMTLLSLEYDYKYTSLVTAIKNNQTTADVFWTSGTDNGCKGKFGYCTANRTLQEEALWNSGQPDNSGGNEHALAVSLNSSHALLSDFGEDKMFRYICEARDSDPDGTGGNAVRDECAAVYNISQTEIDNIFNTTEKFDERMKCFLKCVGDNAGMMVNGKFVDSRVLAALENISMGNSNELKNNTQLLSACQRAAENMSECDKAAHMIKCSSEKAPEALNSVVMTVQKAMPIRKLSFPLARCFNKCVVNKTLVQEFKFAKNGSKVTNGVVQVRCGKKYLFFMALVNMTEAFRQCCIRGLKIVSLDSSAKATCLESQSVANVSNTWAWTAGSNLRSAKNSRWCTGSKNASFSHTKTFLNVTIQDTKVGGGFVVKLTTKQLISIRFNAKFPAICEQN
ncbi:uncharacterized protein LOC132193874 isoform X2 [Neocloeon triangulifer]|uniref:uncharacterized protein LOC132193874 isoform X2 n=1 Tax=Neocloeon triangulifer TaxID=2078957 RepID=UPI00286F4ECB|nr:uncharacterized protein LOC132193874 isoform X2 [Neocloeon triangulifer]